LARSHRWHQPVERAIQVRYPVRRSQISQPRCQEAARRFRLAQATRRQHRGGQGTQVQLIT